MEFKISNFNIMSDKHFDFYTWDEVKEEEEANRNDRYDKVIEVITQINRRENIDVMTFQEVTEHSIGKLRDYANNNRYSIYENDIKSADRPLILVTMIKNILVNANRDENIIDLTDNYQNFYNKQNYHTTNDDYFSGRAQVFYIRSEKLIVVNVHAPGLPDGFVQELWYKSLTSFIRCGCVSNQQTNNMCYPYNDQVKIIFIGDFNVSDGAKITEWTNHEDKNPKLILNIDIQGRNTSYHSGIKDPNGVWKPDPNPYQKVDHMMYTENLVPDNKRVITTVYVSNVYGEVANFLDRNVIDNKIIPYSRNPALVMDAGPGQGAPDPVNANWTPNYNPAYNGWPSDHTFNLYTFNANLNLLGGSNKKERRYRIIY